MSAAGDRRAVHEGRAFTVSRPDGARQHVGVHEPFGPACVDPRVPHGRSAVPLGQKRHQALATAAPVRKAIGIVIKTLHKQLVKRVTNSNLSRAGTVVKRSGGSCPPSPRFCRTPDGLSHPIGVVVMDVVMDVAREIREITAGTRIDLDSRSGPDHDGVRDGAQKKITTLSKVRQSWQSYGSVQDAVPIS